MKKNSKEWGHPYGEKGNSLSNRPLVPIVISFAGGILAAHQLPLPSSILLGIIIVVPALSVALFSSIYLKYYAIFPVCFLAGALLVRAGPPPSILAPFAAENKRAVIRGVILDPVQVSENKTGRFTLLAEVLYLPGKEMPLDEHIAITVYRGLPDLHPGDRISFTAGLRPFKNFNNPGNYNYRLAMELKGLTCAANVSDGASIMRLGTGRLPFFRGIVEGLQRPVRDFFHDYLDPSQDAFFCALILGERQGITPGLREPFNRTGLGHVLAVSGLHVGLVAGIFFFLIKRVLFCSYRMALTINVRKLTAVLTCFPVIGYALLAGFQVSTQRAMIMILAYLASIVLGRERDVWSTLSLAGLIILIINPGALFSISFQLSFMAVIGILWLTPPILQWLRLPPGPSDKKRRLGHRLIHYLIDLSVVSASAAFFLLPLTCLYFHRIPLISVPANVTTLPILGIWVIPAGLLSSAAVPFSTELAACFLRVGDWGLTLFISIVRFWAGLPWSEIRTVTPNLFESLLFYFLIMSIFFFRRSRWARIGLFMAIAVTLGDVAYWVYKVRFNPYLQVTFLDVGKGNAALVSFPGGKKMLIDGGGFARGSFDVGERIVAPYLWHSKISQVDYLVLSHPHEDHMNGLRFIARHFHPKEFWTNGDRVQTPAYRDLLEIVDSHHIRTRLPWTLDAGLEINGVRVQVLHPDRHNQASEIKGEKKPLNNRSLVLKISWGGASFLFPGDLEKTGEKALVGRWGRAIRSDILLSPHHGSKTSNTREFLEAVKPQVCIISSRETAGRNFPHPTVLERFHDMDCRVLTTARAGAVTITVRQQNQWDVNTFLTDGSLSEKISPDTGPRPGLQDPACLCIARRQACLRRSAAGRRRQAIQRAVCRGRKPLPQGFRKLVVILQRSYRQRF